MIPASPKIRSADALTRHIWLIALVSLSATVLRAEKIPGSAQELAGLWGAKRSFGPEVRGTVTLEKRGQQWRADIAGRSVDARADGAEISFEVAGRRGSFRGRLNGEHGRIQGHWTQPPLTHSGLAYTSPVVLEPIGRDLWQGEVVPLDDEFTLFLRAEAREDGTVGAFLRNPDRNIGVFMNADRLERDGNRVRLLGTFFRNEDEILLAEGTYDPDWDRLSLYLGNRGGTYDFARFDDDEGSAFYARGQNPGRYRYFAPPARNDGWVTATLEDVGISIEPIAQLIETEIDPPARSVHAPYLHGLLIARHGKLVFEEYFHGFHRDKAHDTRSASKSLTSTLVGAAIQAGAPLDVSSPVYETVRGHDIASDTDPRKLRMTLEHLLTMSSGFDCDDGDESTPGNEDVMQSQSEEPDWYRYTLDLPMVREPGERPVYCSINANLIGAVLTAATGRLLPELLQELMAEPLEIRRYYLNLMPTGTPYMGGGSYWLPRDFMKLGQLMLDRGAWNGRRVLSEAWVERARSPLVEIRDRRYGYQWWLTDYPYGDRSVQAFFAGGNGGQVVIAVPELRLLAAFFAGNYSDRVLYRIQDEFFPQYILAAVDRHGAH